MKITEVKTFKVAANRQNWLFVKVTTDTGLYGWGEASTEGQEPAVEAAVQTLAERSVIGEDPLNIEKIWRQMYHHGFWKGGFIFMSAISGIDMALWDILGKYLKVPVYTLLGGAVRDKIKTYTHALTDVGNQSAHWVSEGFCGVKTAGWTYGVGDDSIAADVLDERLSEIRKAIGKDKDIIVDNHGHSTVALAIKLIQASKRHNLLFFEEPVAPENPLEYKRLREVALDMPIAFGERIYSKFEAREAIENQLLDYIQPDICHCGGISEIRKIASYAEVYHIKFAPHSPNGPVASAATMHIAASTHNFSILEFEADSVWSRKDIYNMDFKPKDGYFSLPKGVGLGIDLDESLFEKYPWKFKQYDRRYYVDGTVGEI